VRAPIGTHWVGFVVVIGLVAAGCAGARPRPDLAATPSQPSAETCEEEAARGISADMMWAAVREGVPATIYLVLRGAGEGAYRGAITGGSAGRGAWIGAVVGAGVGFGIGAVVSVARGFEARGNYLRALERCKADMPPVEYVQRPEPDSGSNVPDNEYESPPPSGGQR
jgi:hypothetical protein